jgi:hypothetical protein
MSPIFSCTWTLEFQAATCTCSFLSFPCCGFLVFWWNQSVTFVHGGFEFPSISQIFPPTYLSVDTSKERVLFVGCLQFMFFGFKNPKMIQGTHWYCKKLHIFHFNKQMLDYLSILFNIVHDNLSNWWPGKYMMFQPSLLTRNPQVNMWNCNNEVHLGSCIYVFCESLLDGTPMNIVCKHGSVRHTQICAKTVTMTTISWPRFSLSLLVCVEIYALNFSRAMVSNAMGI